jgi:hypothetical protein
VKRQFLPSHHWWMTPIIKIKIPWKQHFLGKNYLECRIYFTAKDFEI